jgi:hypothetical protein
MKAKLLPSALLDHFQRVAGGASFSLGLLNDFLPNLRQAEATITLKQVL